MSSEAIDNIVKVASDLVSESVDSSVKFFVESKTESSVTFETIEQMSEDLGSVVGDDAASQVSNYIKSGITSVIAGLITATLLETVKPVISDKSEKLSLDYENKSEEKERLDFGSESEKKGRVIQMFTQAVCQQMSTKYVTSRANTIGPHLRNLMKECGNDAVAWCKEQGRHIKEISNVIPVYGWAKGSIELSHLKAETMRRFRAMAKSSITHFLNSNFWDKKAINAFKQNFNDHQTTSAWHQTVNQLSHYPIMFESIGNELSSGGQLNQGQRLSSTNCTYSAVMQCDGNFVVYNASNFAIWASNTCGIGTGPFRLVMETDGNLALKDLHDNDNTTTWSTGTSDGQSSAKMDDHGTVIVTTNTGNETWHSIHAWG